MNDSSSWINAQCHVTAAWTVRDVLTYALAVGAHPATDEPCLNESTGPLLVPTFATYAAGPWMPHLHREFWSDRPDGLVVGLTYRIHQPIPVEGCSDTQVRVTGYEVKPRSELVWLTTETTLDGRPLLTGRHAILFPGGGVRRTVGEVGTDTPDLAPTGAQKPESAAAVTVAIDERAIALYRLLLPLRPGQPAPDPAHVRGPTSDKRSPSKLPLHGTALLGHVGLAVSRLNRHRPLAVAGFGCRFVRPAFPGDRLTITEHSSKHSSTRHLTVSDDKGADILTDSWIDAAPLE